VRRRRTAAVALAAVAVGSFAIGVGLAGGPSSQPSPADLLSLPQLAGQRLVVGFPGAQPPKALRSMIHRGEVAGVILFSPNLPGRAAARRTIARLQAIPRPLGLRDPLLVMVDQEGGEVKRLPGAPAVSAKQMGARGPAFSRNQGVATAANLRDVGVNVDLAPVLDVARPGGTIAVTDRGFGPTAAEVAATAAPFAAGLRTGGVAATAKHFPGLGATPENTDFAAQRVGLSKLALRRIDEVPYRSFVEEGGQLVMLSTAIYPAFSPRPAAFASPIAKGELRSRLGFEGVSITDALESAAVRDFGGTAKVALAAARAGTDILLFADYRAAERARRALLRAMREGSLPRPDFALSVERVLALRRWAGSVAP
jgi:beta-N-acetylhexosaminidase